MTFVLPKLPYDYSDLEPYIDKETMNLHHTKHHQAYVDKLNSALESYEDFKSVSIEELLRSTDKLPSNIKQEIINNGGGHANHSFFWEIMSPKKSEPEGELADLLKSQFGGLSEFKETFTKKAMSVFGSGWAFLLVTKDKKIELKRQSFQNSPLMRESVPVIGIDVWEHAYYLKYQNRRAEYVEAWWNVVNWEQAAKNLKDAL